MPEPAFIALAFDYGTQKIGVAAGQSITATATPLPLLKARDGIPDWDEIRRLLAHWAPAVVVVGLPLNMDGSPSELSQRAQKFANRIHGRFGLEVKLMDERLSTREARLLDRRPGVAVDSLAAVLILESWFALQGRG